MATIVIPELPAGTHATVLEDRDIVTGEWLQYVVVWADRDSGKCTRCGENIGKVVEDCPVLLNTGAGVGGQLDPYSQEHRCGEWNSVSWREADPDKILEAAEDLLAD